MAFVHLHNHTVFSMLDGATRIQDMVNRAVELGMPAVAITDHGYMYGVPDLALACDAVNHNTPEYKTWSHDKAFLEKDRRDELVEPDPEENPREHAQYVKDMAMWGEKGNIDELKPPLVIKPIFGCEVYFTPDETLARDHKPELYHMILLAKDQEGYVNLMQTVSEAAVQGFYYKPRVTLDNLRRHAKGMICTSACIAGIIPKYIDRGDMEGAIKWAETFRDTFDPGDFYIEIQEHGITTDNGLTDEQMDRTLIDIAKQVGVKVIATNDFHYLRREDAPVQDVIMCIGMNAKVDDPNRMRMTGSEFYMKTEEEMRAMFPYCPEACDNTLEIADKCYVELDWDSIILPRFPLLDPGETHESQFRRECEKGLRQHYGATKWEMIRLAVLPFGKSGIVSASMLALGRALGETMAVLMILSPGLNYSIKLLQASQNQTIAANIAAQYPEANDLGVSTLIGTGLILFLITFVVNFIARKLTEKATA